MHLLAVPLFALIRDGAVHAENTDRKVLGLLTLRSVTLQPTGNGAPPAGFSTALMPSKDINAKALVRAWFKADVPSPDGHIIWSADQVGHAHGYFTVVEAPRQHGIHLPGSSKKILEPVTDRVSGTREAAGNLASAWQAFGQAEPQLRQRLCEQVSKAVRSRKESSDTDDVGGD